MTENLEHQHEDVYGKSFALYGKADMLEFIEPFRIRFERNGLDAGAIFFGKNCLDAGCGNGRGSLFMMMHGAGSVHYLDVAKTNIESTKRNLDEFGFPSERGRLGSIEHLPFEDGSFDFVWCNGVIMHTANPDGCLKEIARVLRTGGRAWLYVYGAGGLYWWMIRQFRRMLAGVATETVMASLQLARYPVRYVAEYIDDWKVPYLRTYTRDDLGARLDELGFENTTPLPFGLDYDTSHRRNTNPADAIWTGDGDLRYLLVKVQPSSGDTRPLKSSEYGSDVAFAPELEARFGNAFAELKDLLDGRPFMTVMACAHIQCDFREVLSRQGGLDLRAVEEIVERVLGLVRSLCPEPAL
jgi:SAM-dependent methyltransferase